MSQWILACDVGNSRTKFALFRRANKNSGGRKLPECVLSMAVQRDGAIDWKPLADRLEAEDVDCRIPGLIAGTRPQGVESVCRVWPREYVNEPVVVEQSSRFPLDVRVPEPGKVGIDRLLNAVAANVLRPSGSPAIIVDSGTATTVDAVDGAGAFRGGAILPGIELSARALHRYTALLPMITIDEIAVVSNSALGNDTKSALCSGLFWGQLGAIRELVGRLSRDESLRQTVPQEDSGDSIEPFVLLTGGGARVLKPHLSGALWQPHLSLQGLAVVAEHFLT